MMPLLLLSMWREFIIALLCIAVVWLTFTKMKLEHELTETHLIHQNLVNDSELRNARLVAQHNEQRKIDLENYANEVLNLANRYDAALANSSRVQQETTTYNNRLHTVTRETLENYAKVGTTLYNECRKEYLGLGYYTAKVDAELDSVTKSPD